MQSRGRTVARPKATMNSRPTGIEIVLRGPMGQSKSRIEAAGRTGNFDVPLVIFVVSTSVAVYVNGARTNKLIFVMPETTVAETVNCMKALGSAASNGSLVASGFGSDYEGGAKEVERLAKSVHVNETFWVMNMPVQKLSLRQLQGLSGATIQLS